MDSEKQGNPRDQNAESRRKHSATRKMIGRQPTPKITHVWLSLNQRVAAKVLDESELGLGLLVAAADRPLEVGFQIRVETPTGRKTAKIVSADPVEETDMIRISVAWDT